MPIIKVRFQELHQDSQDYGSNDQHMVSRVFFSIEVDGESKGQFHANLKQVVGSDFEGGEIEVTRPHGWNGPWDHNAFAKAATEYFRDLVGNRGVGIRIEGSSGVRMRNNRFTMLKEFTF